MVRRTFFQRFGHLGVCVLPAEALTNDLLRVDTETHIMSPSLRRSSSALGLCFARVLRSFADGLYWADVAATPDLVDAQRVLFTEEHLYATLPWDIRLMDRCPGDIRKLLFAHAQDVQPAPQQVTHLQDTDQLHALTPVPIVPLESLEHAAVVVTTGDLQEALGGPRPADGFQDTHTGLFERIGKNTKPTDIKRIGSFAMQQALLRAMIDTLMILLYHAQDRVTALSLKTRCTVLAVLQRWHRLNRQRVVNAVPNWSDERQSVVWQLTVGIPVHIRAAA